MMNTEGTDLGKVIRIMQAAGISESHLKKIETGVRKPGIDTYQRMIEVLEADIVINSDMKGSLKDNCMIKAQKILMGCTEPQALYLVIGDIKLFRNLL